LLSVILITLAADQLSKTFIQKLMVEGQSMPVIPAVFYLTYIRNPGAAFGLLPYQKLLFIVISVAIIALMLVVARRIPAHRHFLRTGVGLVTGGAVGNLVDRLRFGLVVDFLDFRVWPVFNLADAAIVIGACLLVLEVWRGELL
jgi:signal peptidase II